MRYLIVAALIFGALAACTYARAHCEIPCGIYDDRMRIDMLREHIDTIEKSMHEIEHLENAGEINYNQLVRWITNKEEHAEKFQYIVYQYFMTQRLSPVSMEDKEAFERYDRQLRLLHEMLYYSMKTKQTLDRLNIEKLRDVVAEFEELYFAQ
jgi:nickel superoxide dismutase